jgi:hypothetical protein
MVLLLGDDLIDGKAGGNNGEQLESMDTTP